MDTHPSARMQSTMKVAIGAGVGTALEWYDFFLYGLASALVFNRLFFPNFDAAVGTLLSFATFGVAFVARPIGAAVFGHMGDRVGRKRALVYTLFIMGGSTLAIGLLPTYMSIGIWAPVLLVALRFIQGIGLGGEWAGAVLMTSEHSAPQRRGLIASWVQVGAPAGNLIATGIFGLLIAVLPQEALQSWGWRIPFLASSFLVGVGLWIRRTLEESPEFDGAAGENASSPLVQVLRQYPVRVLAAAAVRIAPDVSYYIWTVFVFTYIAHVDGVSRQTAVNALLAGSALQLVLIPAAGHLSDRVSRRAVYLAGAGGTAVWSVAFFVLLDTRSPVLAFVAIVGGLACHALMYGPQAALISEMFPAHVRYSGAALGSQFSGIVGAAFAPLLAAYLLTTYGSYAPVTIYLLGCSLVTIVAAGFLSQHFLSVLRRRDLGPLETSSEVVVRP